MKTPEVNADRTPAVKEIHVVWMTTGLSCDGDSVSITAASLPSIEDIVLGAIPGLPKVHLHNPVLAYEVGDDLMKYWHLAAEGKLEPFVLVLDGIGGCPNVGGICIGCTMPGFPDKFMPFMDEPPGATFSSMLTGKYGGLIRSLRAITNRTLDKEPKWRRPGVELRTGYEPAYCGNGHGNGHRRFEPARSGNGQHRD